MYRILEPACKGLQELFFATDKISQNEAKQICYDCPLYERCKAYVLCTPYRIYGVAGGYTERERIALVGEKPYKLESLKHKVY